MKMSSSHSDGDGGFYKGLVFGALIGVGLVWFLGTKEGKKIKKQLSERSEEFIEKAKESIDEALEEGLVEDDQVSPDVNEGLEFSPKRFFDDK